MDGRADVGPRVVGGKAETLRVGVRLEVEADGGIDEAFDEKTAVDANFARPLFDAGNGAVGFLVDPATAFPVPGAR